MIIIKVMGGLGNQMQQYALYEKFLSLGKDAKLDMSWFTDSVQQGSVYAKRALELSYFNCLEYRTCTEAEKRELLGKGFWGRDGLGGKAFRKLRPVLDRQFTESWMYHPQIFEFQNKYLIGHWACEKYYHDIMPLLQKKIRFPESGEPRNAEIAAQMEAESSVSVHVRRGDYLEPENAAMFGGICTEAYYEAAEKYIRERVPDARIYLFSDDPEYMRARYRGDEYTVVDWNTGKDSFYDMELMSHCKHNICANSTFSFWGARLNAHDEKIMIRPEKHKNGQAADPGVMKELWDEWVLMDEKGRNTNFDIM